MKSYFLAGIVFFIMILPRITFWCTSDAQIEPLDIMSKSFLQEQQAVVFDRYQACIRGEANTEDEYFCPSKDSGFFWDGKAITNEIIAYNIAVEAVFQKLDEKTKVYKKQLQNLRCADPYKWKTDIREQLYGNPEKNIIWIRDSYKKVCEFWYIQELINAREDGGNPSNNPIQISTSDTYPQSICQDLAEKKVIWLSYVGDILMAEWTAKTIQNDKDTFVDVLKWRYRALLDKIHELMQIIDRASKKKNGNDIQTVGT